MLASPTSARVARLSGWQSGQVQMNCQCGGRGEDFCGACGQQSIAGDVGRCDSVKSDAATLCGAEVRIAVADEGGVRSIDGK